MLLASALSFDVFVHTTGVYSSCSTVCSQAKRTPSASLRCRSSASSCPVPRPPLTCVWDTAVRESRPIADHQGVTAVDSLLHLGVGCRHTRSTLTLSWKNVAAREKPRVLLPFLTCLGSALLVLARQPPFSPPLPDNF